MYAFLEQFILTILPGDEARNFRSFTDTPFWDNPPKQPSAIIELTKYLNLRYFIPSLKNNNYKQLLDGNNVSTLKEKNNVQLNYAWDELSVLLEKSKYPIILVLTPPKRWLLNSKSNLEEINIYKKLLDKTLNLKKVEKVCNLYDFAKSSTHESTYVDGVHLSEVGHKLWSDMLISCINNES